MAGRGIVMYKKEQIIKLANCENSAFKLKIKSSENETKYLNINREQLLAIAQLLEKDLEPTP